MARLWSAILLLAFIIWALTAAPMWVPTVLLIGIGVGSLVFASVDVYQRGFELEDRE